MGNNIAILGSFSGDESKGRLTQYFSRTQNFDWVVRTSGAGNCGHTIYYGKQKLVHHFVPSLDFNNPNVRGFMSAGMVIDLHALHKELLGFENIFPGCSKKFVIDPDAFLVQDKHIQEDKEKNNHIGTTQTGTGPAYKDKIARTGTKIRDLIDKKKTDSKQEEALDSLLKLGVQFKHVLSLKEDFKKSKILFEGAQGLMLDINQGVYPYVSCGDCTPAGIYSAGFNFAMPSTIYGVLKPYATKAYGAGPFPSEASPEEAQILRELGGEIGATTGKPRRCGWLDLVALKYAVEKAGITDLILSKTDVLNNFGKIKVATKYDREVFSSCDFFDAKAILEEVDGWSDPSDWTQMSKFIKLIEEHVGVKVRYMTYGLGEDDIKKVEGEGFVKP